LVSEFWSKKLELLFEQLPPISLVNLEVRLSAENSRVDGNILLKPFESNTLRSWIIENEISDLKFLLKALEDWSDPKTLFHSIVGNMWLMYDLHENKNEVPIPWIIFSIPNLNIGTEAFLAVIKKISNYFPNTLSNKHWTIFNNALLNMPQEAYVPAIGIQNRGANSLRFGVKNFRDIKTIQTYLAAIEWPGDFNFIEKNYSEMIQLAEYCDVSLTIGDHLLPDLGIECYFRSEDSEEHNKQMLEYLTSIGLCSDMKCQAILDWYGRNDEFPDIWSDSLPALEHSDKQYINRLNGTLKAVYTPDAPPSAKAYLYFARTC
jgi:hypothetical protein